MRHRTRNIAVHPSESVDYTLKPQINTSAKKKEQYSEKVK